MLHWNPTDAALSFDTRLSPSMPEARDLRGAPDSYCLQSASSNLSLPVRIAIRPIPGDHLSAIGPEIRRLFRGASARPTDRFRRRCPSASTSCATSERLT